MKPNNNKKNNKIKISIKISIKIENRTTVMNNCNCIGKAKWANKKNKNEFLRAFPKELELAVAYTQVIEKTNGC